jgi:hypothetical protein
VRSPGRAGFTRLDGATTGILFTNLIPESRHLTNQILLNGSGLAAGDIDGDELTDLFFCGFDNANSLYRNQGNWKFHDIAPAAGVQLPEFDCTGAALGDLDGDRDLDLVINTLGQGTLILLNDGKGRFTRSPEVLNPGRGGMTAALADVDTDGDLDLYIANYRTRALMDMPNTRMSFRNVGGRPTIDTVNGRPASDPEFEGRFVINAAGGIEENGEPDALFLNTDGKGRFEEVPWTAGRFLDADGAPLTTPPRDWGLAAMFRDVDQDGRPDLYVCNDFQSPDRLWLNQGGGRFQLAPPLALRRTSLSSMAVDFADINRDGADDFLVVEMLSRDHAWRMRWVRENFPHQPIIGEDSDRPQIEQNTLHLALGRHSWSEIAQLSGLEATEWTWGCAFIDVDLDGWEDLLVVNGMERAGRDHDVAERLKAARTGRRLNESEIFTARKAFPRLATANLAFRNERDLTFRDSSSEWGFDLQAVSQTLALADLDNDGDLDAVVGNLNESVAIYRNDCPAPRVAVRLRGRPANIQGIGARIEVHGGPVLQHQEMTAGGRYLASDDSIRAFAAGTAEALTIRVHWPGGAISVTEKIPPNSMFVIEEPATPPDSTPAESSAAPVSASSIRFEEVSAMLDHRHPEAPSDDFSRQPLLPHRLSQPGPGLAWCDLDNDQDEDLVIGAGRQGTLAAFRNENGRLTRWDHPALRTPLSRDATALLPWADKPGHITLLTALANYEDGAPLGHAVVAWDPARSSSLEPVIPASDSSPGPLAMADIDSDGDLDLFIGGRVLPGQWPVAASSLFFRNEQGRLVQDNARSRVLAGIGLVTSALFTDIDGDGDADLVLACEWGPLRVLRQDKDGFMDVTEALGLSACTGWWNSVAAGDFNNDGRMDLAAGNWGRNTPYESHRQLRPNSTARGSLRLYHGDFNRDSTYDVIEAWYDPQRGSFLPRHPLLTLVQSLPDLRQRFPSHAAFGEASIEGILGPARSTVLAAAWLESTVFINRGERFDPTPLPLEAQFAPVFGMAVGDADGDGNEDLFLAQNFFAVRPYTPRYDGGLGLWLRGDGAGGFRSVSPDESGIRIHGEQRGTALADFDGDGRIDLVVGQNGAGTRLFRNQSARPALRLRLQGPDSNPAAVSARFRWVDAPTPVREINAGSGYLSQNAFSQIASRPHGATTLRVRWPGGFTRDYSIPVDAAARVLTVDESQEAAGRQIPR